MTDGCATSSAALTPLAIANLLEFFFLSTALSALLGTIMRHIRRSSPIPEILTAGVCRNLSSHRLTADASHARSPDVYWAPGTILFAALPGA
jgi:hypothetical protein